MRCRVALLRSDGPHNRYLKKVLEQSFNVVLDIEEQSNQKWRRLLRAGKWRSVFDLQYQSFRRDLMGLTRYRRRHFDRLSERISSASGPTVHVPWINDPKVSEMLAATKPDITIVMGCSILKPHVLAQSGAMTINIHGGYLPYYRGNHCFFFALLEGAYDHVGSTMHFVDPGVDTGDIIELVPEKVRPQDNAETLYCRAEERAIHRLEELLNAYEDGISLPRVAQRGPGRTYKTADRTLMRDFQLWFRRRWEAQKLSFRELVASFGT